MRIRSGILFSALAIACLATGYDAKAAGEAMGGTAEETAAKERSAATESLFLAVRANDIGAAKASLLAGADVDAENDDGRTPIDVAVDRGHFPIAHYLLAWRKHLAIQRDRKATAAAPPPPPPPPEPELGPRPETPFETRPNPSLPMATAAKPAPAAPAFEPKAEPAADPPPVAAAAPAAKAIQPVAPLADSGKIVRPEIASQEPGAFGRIGGLFANKPAAVTPPVEPRDVPDAPRAGEPSPTAQAAAKPPEPASKPAPLGDAAAASEPGNPLTAIIDFLTAAKPPEQDDPAKAAATPPEPAPEPAPMREAEAKPAPAPPAFEPKAEPAADPPPVAAAAPAAKAIQPVAPLADSGKIVRPEIASQEPGALGRIGGLFANKPATVTPPVEPRDAPRDVPRDIPRDIPRSDTPSPAAQAAAKPPEPAAAPAPEPAPLGEVAAKPAAAASEPGNPLAAIIEFLTTAKPPEQDDPAKAAATLPATAPEPAPMRVAEAKPAPAPPPVEVGPAKPEPAADGQVADGRATAATGWGKEDGAGLFDGIAKILADAQRPREAADTRPAAAPKIASASAEPVPPAKVDPPVASAARDDASELLGRITDFIFVRPKGAAPPATPTASTESPAATKSNPPAAAETARLPPAKVVPTMRRAAVEPAIGADLRLGKMPPAGGRDGCIEKTGMNTSFCIEPVDWPRAIADAFEATSSIYRGRQTIVRYDGGVATQFHALFPTGNFEAVGSYFSKLLGPPSDRPELWVPMIATANRKNRALVWLGPKPPDGGVGSVLEVREFDDQRWSSPPDVTHGAVRLYGAVDETLFKYVSWSDFLLVKMRRGKY